MVDVEFLTFGDSVTYGAWDIEGGWNLRLRKFMEEKYPDVYYNFYNMGIDTDTTTSLLKRFENETKSRILGDKIIFIFQIGLNDSCFVKSKNKFISTIEIFEENIQKLIKMAKKYSNEIVFIGISPVDKEKVNPIPWSKTGKSYDNINIEKYDSILKSICAKNNVHFMEVFNKWINLNYKKLLDDGLHPNTEGHEIIFEDVKNFLNENKII